MNNLLNISFLKLSRQYLNWRLDSWNWMGVMLTELQNLHSAFLDFRAESIYKLSHGSQKIYLEKCLNDYFDQGARRIYIDNAIIREPVWFYEVDDNKPVLFYEEEDNRPVYFRKEVELVGNGIDFTVWVPVDLKPLSDQDLENFENQLKALVDYYKLYSKNYEIEYHE